MRVFLGLVLLSLVATIVPIEAAENSDWRNALLQHLSYKEPFNNPKRGAFGGAIKPGSDGPWTIELGGGTLAYTNTTDSSAIRHAEIYRTRFTGIDWQTDGAEVSTTLQVTTAEGGAAGLLAGYPGTGDYLVFGIGGGSNYTILQKVAGKATILASGENEAIHADGMNRLALAREGSNFSFTVNGAAIFEVARDSMATAPVGLAVFGKGRFAFSDYEIVPALPILERVAANTRGCNSLPLPGAGDKLIVLNNYDGAAASSVTVVGQDRETSVIDVSVTPGDEKLFVVASATEPVIWRVHGAVDRISRFETLVGTGKQAGVVGLARDRVGFHPADDCLRSSHEDILKEVDYVRGSLAFGRPVDQYIGEYSPASVELPSGAVTPDAEIVAEGLPPHANRAELDDALRYTPAGLVRLAPADVVAPVPVESYDVLPQEWGLLQLLADGSIVPAERQKFQKAFTATRPMRFPAGLAGAHAVTFFVPANLPMPLGNPGHCDIIRTPAEEQPEAGALAPPGK